MDCPHCEWPIMLHVPNCSKCGFKNVYVEYSAELNVDNHQLVQAEATVLKYAKLIHSDFKDDAVDIPHSSSLKSSRGERKKSTIMVDYWKCPKCKILNRLGTETLCSNSKNKLCKFDI